LTGRHEFKNGVTHTVMERERLAPDAVTLAEVLKSADYTTGIFGKWHLGDEPDRWPSRRGFDEMFIHGAGGIGQSYEGSCGDAPDNTYFDPAILHNGKFIKTKGYCSDVFFNQALAWMVSHSIVTSPRMRRTHHYKYGRRTKRGTQTRSTTRMLRSSTE
jgi:arylsulfatase